MNLKSADAYTNNAIFCDMCRLDIENFNLRMSIKRHEVDYCDMHDKRDKVIKERDDALFWKTQYQDELLKRNSEIREANKKRDDFKRYYEGSIIEREKVQRENDSLYIKVSEYNALISEARILARKYKALYKREINKPFPYQRKGPRGFA